MRADQLSEQESAGIHRDNNYWARTVRPPVLVEGQTALTLVEV